MSSCEMLQTKKNLHTYFLHKSTLSVQVLHLYRFSPKKGVFTPIAVINNKPILLGVLSEVVLWPSWKVVSGGVLYLHNSLSLILKPVDPNLGWNKIARSKPTTSKDFNPVPSKKQFKKKYLLKAEQLVDAGRKTNKYCLLSQRFTVWSTPSGAST